MARVISAGVSGGEEGDGGGVVLDLAVSCMAGAGEVGGGGGVSVAPDSGPFLGRLPLLFGVSPVFVVGVLMCVCWW
jgi:hypothetical protein